MRYFVTQAVCIAWLFASGSVQAAELTSDAQIQKEVRLRLQQEGWNCPVPLRYDEVGEDARGKLYRVDCKSSDGSKTWALRIISPPGHASRTEPW